MRGTLLAMGMTFLLGAAGAVPAGAGQPDEARYAIHYGLSGVIAKIQAGMLFVKTPVGLMPRTISPAKADRVGLHEARVGDTVLVLVDSGNVLLDAWTAGRPEPEHRMIAGTLRYADPFWGEVQLSTDAGAERFEVDVLAGSKLSVFHAGMSVAIELDADNVLIDIQRVR